MIIYSSIDNLELRKHEVRSYAELCTDFKEWIEETAVELLSKRNSAELRARNYLREIYKEVHEQPFFMIANRSYFLDFFIPSRNLAVEIDGGYHKRVKKYDKQRDIDFLNIGIRTVRIAAGKVIKEGITLKDLNNYTVSKKKKKRKRKPNYCGIINKTHRKIRSCKNTVYDANYLV